MCLKSTLCEVSCSLPGTSELLRKCGIILRNSSISSRFSFLLFSYPQLEGNEGPNIAKCFKSKDFTAFMGSGIHAEGTKYQFLREEDKKLVLAKKKDHGAITLQASKSAIVIGHCQEGSQQGNVNKGVAVIAEYLESLGM